MDEPNQDPPWIWIPNIMPGVFPSAPPSEADFRSSTPSTPSTACEWPRSPLSPAPALINNPLASTTPASAATPLPVTPPLESVFAPQTIDGSPSSECGRCVGDHYNFSKYFHNTKTFSEPPHSMIGFIDAAYEQRRHLNRLLSKYPRQNLQRYSLEGVEEELKRWVYDVDALIADVRLQHEHSEIIGRYLNDMFAWAEEMGKMLQEHVIGAQTILITDVQADLLVVGFRKTWERVWFACAREDGISTAGIMDMILPSQVVSSEFSGHPILESL